MVPVYGVEKYIEKCAVSLFEQSHDDVEFIFVDDCSPDDSIARLTDVLSRYPHRQDQTRIIRQPQNGGVGAARHAAVEAATGEAVMFVDSDDYLLPDAVASLCEAMERTGADIVDGGFVKVVADEEGETIQPFQGKKEALLKLMLCQNIVTNRLWGRLFKRSLFTAHDINFTPGTNYGEDYEVLAKLLFFGSRVALNKAVYAYRDDNATSLSHTFSEKQNTMLYCANSRVSEFLKEHDVDGTYATAVQMSQLAMVRHARRYEGHFSNLDNHCTIKLKCLTLKSCNALLRSKALPFSISNFIYLAIRRIYSTFA